MTDLQTMADLEDATGSLGDHYLAWKYEEKLKNQFKDEFFSLANEMIVDRLDRQLIIIDLIEEPAGRTVEHVVTREHPTYLVSSTRQIGDYRHEVEIEEDPAFKPFTYVNPTFEDEGVIGWVFKRTISAGPVLLDDERLKRNDPGLWRAITYIVPWSDEALLMPLDKLSSANLARINQYIYEGKPSIKLTAPRPAKPEELTEVEGEES